MNNGNNFDLLLALEQSLPYMQGWLSKFTDEPDFEEKIKFIFGTQIDVL